MIKCSYCHESIEGENCFVCSIDGDFVHSKCKEKYYEKIRNFNTLKIDEFLNDLKIENSLNNLEDK